MSAFAEMIKTIRAGDRYKEERAKTIHFATTTDRPILPLEPLSKSTLGSEHYDASWHPDKLNVWRNEWQIDYLKNNPELNIGVLFGDDVLDIDIDSKDEHLVAALKHYLKPFPTPFRWGRESKEQSHIAYVLSEPFDRASHARAIKALAEYEELRVEVRGGESKSNFFAVMPGSIHKTGELVVWAKEYDIKESIAPVLDVRPILLALRRAVAAALVARSVTGGRHYFFLSLTGMLVRMWKQAEDSETTESAMNQTEAWDFINFIQKLIGDEDDRKDSFNKTWKKFVDDPTIPISGGTALAKQIGVEGARVRNLIYKLLVDDEGFEVAEGALERFVMIRSPSAGVLDLETLRPDLRVTGAMKQEDLSMLFTSVKIPFGEKSIPLPAFLKHSSQVVKATGLELRPDMPPREIFKVYKTVDDHGFESESVWINAWVGFQYLPADRKVEDEEIKPFLEYVWEVIANKQKDRYQWVLAWLADIFQDPANKPGTLLALTGPQGSGKTMLGEIIGKIIGDAHYGKIGSIEDLTKEFNSRVHYKLFVQADETGAGQRTAISRDLKELVTGSHQTIVYKGKEGIPSFNPARYFFTSNDSGHALKVEPGRERRYTILEVSPYRVGNAEYWDQFVAWWAQGKNLRAIHKWLLTYEYDKKTIRTALSTEEKKDHQANALPPVVQWAVTRAAEGYPIAAENHRYAYQAYFAKKVQKGGMEFVSPPPNYADRTEWPNLVELAALTEDFNFWLRSQNIRALQPANSVAKLMSDLRGGGRAKYNSISTKREGVSLRPKLMQFPTRQEYIEGICMMYPALEKNIREMTEMGDDLSMEGEGVDLSGEI